MFFAGASVRFLVLGFFSLCCFSLWGRLCPACGFVCLCLVLLGCVLFLRAVIAVVGVLSGVWVCRFSRLLLLSFFLLRGSLGFLMLSLPCLLVAIVCAVGIAVASGWWCYCGSSR